MRRSALTKLRVGFILLLIAVLVPLAFLLRDVRARLEAQQALRHRIVAERIFDEMERELTEQLVREGERPSSAYDAEHTHVSTWAPFVVGYFTRDANGLKVIAREQLGAERARGVEEAVRAATRGAPASQLEPEPEQKKPLQDADKAQPSASVEVKSRAVAKSARKKEAAPADSASVLRQLNRGAEQREDLKVKSKRKADVTDSLEADPLGGP